MKILFAVILFISFNFAGCYTVLWTPDKEFPSESSYYGGEGYYTDPYYSDPYISYYYEYPWWLSISPPTTSGDRTSERYEDVQKIRNGGRGGDNTPRIDPPTRSTGSTSGSTNPEVSKPQNTETKRSDNSNKSGNKSEDRNGRNSGGRNSGGGRK